MDQENVSFNQTLNQCFIQTNIDYPNRPFMDYDSCPELYTNSTNPLIFGCCLKIILEKLERSPILSIQNWLTYYSSSLLVGPAIIFNLLAFLVLLRFSKSNQNATSINFYMQCLCVFDTLTIILKFLHEYMVVRNTVRKNPFKINSSACKLTHFSESTFGITSIYILILMSIDRFICVAFPFKSGSILRPNRAKLMCIFVLLFTAIYSSHHLFIHKVHVYRTPNNLTVYDCVFSNEITASKMKIVDNFIRVFVPILLLCMCNILIVIILAKARQNTMTFLAETSSDNHVQKNSKSFTKSLKHDNITQAEEIMLNPTNSTEKEHQYSKKIKRRKCNSSNSDKNSNYISIMLFTVSFGFIVLNLPYAINTIYEQNFKEKHNVLDFLLDSEIYDLKKNFTKTEIIKAVHYDFYVFLAHFLLDLNYVANFFFYFLSGVKFRKRLYSIFRFKNVKCTKICIKST